MQLPRSHAETVCLRLQKSRNDSSVTDLANGRTYSVHKRSASPGLELGKPAGPMIPYASRTPMRSAVDAMVRHGWRMLIEPSQEVFSYGKTPAPLPYMIDNGAWGCFKRGAEWDGDGFERYLDLWGAGADLIVLPDIVEGGEASLARSVEWVEKVAPYGAPMLLAVQDGMPLSSVRRLLERHHLGIFIGGSTEWKLKTLPDWGRMARRVGCWAHAARVNTAKRLRLCQLAGMHSFDGTTVTKWPSTIRLIENARNQTCLF